MQKNTKNAKKNAHKKRVKTSKRYVTGKGGQAICYKAIYMAGGGQKMLFSALCNY